MSDGPEPAAKGEAAPAQEVRLSAATKWAAMFVVLLVGVALVLGAAEGFVRARQLAKYGIATSLESMYRVDESLQLRVLVPGKRIGNISINSSGFRGPEISTYKQPGTLRIAFLGASTTFCGETSGDTAVWPHLVTERLKQAYSGTRFDYVNGGVPGYVVASTRKNLRHKVAPLKPDVIVIYHATNDFSGEVRDLAVKQGVVPSAETLQQGFLERHSLLWELVSKNLRVMRAQQADTGSTARRIEFNPQALAGGFREELGMLIREARAVAPHVAVVTFSSRLRREQSAEEKSKAAVSAFVYMPFMTVEGLLAGYARYNEVITEVATREGVQLIGGEHTIPGDAAHFVDSVHFSDKGSQAMAERVFGALAADPRLAELVRTRTR